MDRPGSWNVLMVSLVIAYATAKWLASRAPALVGPVMMLTTFITTKYAPEIEQLAHRIRQGARRLFRFSWFRSHQA